MKKVLVSLVAVVLMAGAANGATLGLVHANPGVAGPAQIDVVIDTLAADIVSGIGFTWLSNGALDQVDTTPGILLDQDQSVNSTKAVGFNTLGGATPLPGGGSYIAGSFFVDGAPGTYEITFWHETVALLDETGGAYTFGPTYVGMFPHMYSYGAGCPGADGGAYGSQAANPLSVTIIPEPASLALLAFGGLALIRRR